MERRNEERSAEKKHIMLSAVYLTTAYDSAHTASDIEGGPIPIPIPCIDPCISVSNLYASIGKITS